MQLRSLVFALALGACAADRGGPTPAPSAVSPMLICTAQFPTTLTISGTDFSPAVLGALTDEPSVDMPRHIFSAGATAYEALKENVVLPNGDRSGTKLGVTIP